MGKSEKVRFAGPWTWSRLDDFETCPLKFKFKHIDKLTEASSPALERGSDIHNEIDAYLNGYITKIKSGIKLLKELAALKNLKPVTERLWAHDKKYEPLPDSFDKNAWCRAKLDASVETKDRARVIDFKTGRIYPDNEDQVRFYGMLGLKRAPTKNIAQLELWYVDQGIIKPLDPITRKEVPALEKEFTDRAGKIYLATEFQPTPGLYCTRCQYRKNAGGPCPVGS